MEHYRTFGQVEAFLMPATNEGGFGLVVYSREDTETIEDEATKGAHPDVFEQRFMEFTEQEVQELKKLQETTELVHSRNDKSGTTLRPEIEIDVS